MDSLVTSIPICILYLGLPDLFVNHLDRGETAKNLLEEVHDIRGCDAKFRALAAYQSGMYRDNRQSELPDFYLPFGGKLDPEIRWVKLARVVPWHLIEDDYRSNFATSGMGAPAKESRIAQGGEQGLCAVLTHTSA